MASLQQLRNASAATPSQDNYRQSLTTVRNHHEQQLGQFVFQAHRGRLRRAGQEQRRRQVHIRHRQGGLGIAPQLPTQLRPGKYGTHCYPWFLVYTKMLTAGLKWIPRASRRGIVYWRSCRRPTGRSVRRLGSRRSRPSAVRILYHCYGEPQGYLGSSGI